MKKIYVVDTWRRMKRTLVTVLSIILIVCLGLSSYLGIAFARISMEETGDYNYSKQKLHNFEVTYNYGISSDDIEKLSEIEEIDLVEGLYKTTGFLLMEQENRLVTVQSVTENIDIAEVLDGALPVKADEIAIEKVMAEEDGIKIGDSLEINCEDEEGTSLLLEKKFKVVGIVQHPAYSCNYVYSRRGLSEKGNGNCLNYFLVSDEAFDTEELDGCYQSALIWSDELKSVNCFSDAYEKKSDEIKQKIEEVAPDQSKARYDEVKADADKQVSDAQKELDDASKELDGYEKDIQDGEEKLKDAKDELEDFKEQYPNLDFTEQEDEIKDAEEELETNREKYEDAKVTLEENQTKLDDAKAEVADLVEVEWNIYDRDANVSYAMYKDNAEGLGNLSFSFAFVYIVVAFMVCYSSIGRMITKQKQLIGTQKALGFRVNEIMTQYLSYTSVCTFWGCVWGVVWAIFFVEKISLTSYKPIYYFKEYFTSYDVKLTAVVVITAFILTGIATISACRKQIKKSTVSLLKDEVVGDGKEFFFEKWKIWKKIALFKRTIVKNLLNEKRHMITTIIGVAGCTALMIIGFTLKFAITDVKKEQFDNIQMFDLSLQVEADKNGKSYVDKLDGFDKLEYISFTDQMVGVQLNQEDNIVADLLCADVKELNQFFLLEDKQSKETIDSLDEGVLLSANTAEYYDVKVNDNIEIMKKDGEKVSVPVAGIVKNYVCHFLVMTEEYYGKVMEEDVSHNIYFIKLNGTSKSELEAEVSELDGFIDLAGKEMGISIFNNIADSLNSVIQVMICLSAIMALIVVLNLLVMYVNEKSKTLAVMRINGYTIRETKSFLNVSNIILTIIGLAVGVVVGVILGIQIVMIIENDCVTYNHDPNWTACLLSAGICATYSIVLGFIANRKINHLPLTNLNRFE